MIRRPPSTTPLYSSSASDVYKRQVPRPAGNDLHRFVDEGFLRGEQASGRCVDNFGKSAALQGPVSYTHLRAHETSQDIVCRLLLEKKKLNHTSDDCETCSKFRHNSRHSPTHCDSNYSIITGS